MDFLTLIAAAAKAAAWMFGDIPAAVAPQYVIWVCAKRVIGALGLVLSAGILATVVHDAWRRR